MSVAAAAVSLMSPMVPVMVSITAPLVPSSIAVVRWIPISVTVFSTVAPLSVVVVWCSVVPSLRWWPVYRGSFSIRCRFLPNQGSGIARTHIGLCLWRRLFNLRCHLDRLFCLYRWLRSCLLAGASLLNTVYLFFLRHDIHLFSERSHWHCRLQRCGQLGRLVCLVQLWPWVIVVDNAWVDQADHLG